MLLTQKTRLRSPFTTYVLQVEHDGRRWLTFRRYREWLKLHDALSSSFSNVPELPGKVLFGNMSPRVVDVRSKGLQTFLEACLSHVEISASEELRAFLEEEGPPRGIEGMEKLGDLVRSPLRLRRRRMPNLSHRGHSAPSFRQASSPLPGTGTGSAEDSSSAAVDASERGLGMLVDLHDALEPIKKETAEQRKQMYASSLQNALSKPCSRRSLYPEASRHAVDPHMAEAEGSEVKLSAADRQMLKVVSDAAGALVAASPIRLTEQLLVKVP